MISSTQSRVSFFLNCRKLRLIRGLQKLVVHRSLLNAVLCESLK